MVQDLPQPVLLLPAGVPSPPAAAEAQPQTRTPSTLGRHAGGDLLAVLTRTLRRYPAGVAGGLLLAVIATAAVLAPLVAPHRPTAFLAAGPYAAPGQGSLLGTDQVGRDLFSRILYGTRTSLAIAVAATLAGVGLGSAIGVVSGYAGGRLDLVVQRAVEILDAFPALVLAILFVALLGPSASHVAIAIAVVLVPTTNRVVRSLTLGLRQQPFIEAAVASGAAPARMILRHILPGLFATIAIMAAASLGGTIIAEASLSFLGLGPPPPAATLGQMLSGEVRQHFVDDPWLAIMPGLALTLCILAVTLLGDTLRDVADPHYRTRS